MTGIELLPSTMLVDTALCMTAAAAAACVVAEEVLLPTAWALVS